MIVLEIYTSAHVCSFQSVPRGLLPRCMKYYGFVTFYTVFPRARTQVEPVDRFSPFMAYVTCFAQGRSFWGLRQYRNSFISQKLPQKGMNRQFQAKRAAYKIRDILQSINTTNVQFQDHQTQIVGGPQ